MEKARYRTFEFKILFKSEYLISYQIYFQKEIQKVEAENKDYEAENTKLEAGISQVKQATEVVKKTFFK